MKNLLIAFVALVVLGGGYWLWQSNTASPITDTTSGEVNNGANSEANNASSTDTSGMGVHVEVGGSVSTAPMSATITYSGTSFSPQEVTIMKGGTVTWKNASGKNMWVASAQHPTHTAYDGTSRTEHCAAPTATTFDQCKGDGDYSFTFTKTGTWGYHDHLNAQAFGKVTVVE